MGDIAVVSEDRDELEIVPLTAVVIVGVVGGSDLDSTSTEILLHKSICYDGEFSVQERMENFLPNEMFVSVVIRMDSDPRVT